MGTRFLIFFILFISHAASCRAADTTSFSQAFQWLSEDLTAHTKSLSNDFHIYFYFRLTGMVPANDSTQRRSAMVSQYTQSLMSKYWDLNFTANQYINAGPGIYAAIDPLISQNFGNAMLDIRVSAQTRFISVVTPIKLRTATYQALINEGYIQSSDISALFISPLGKGFYRDTLKNMTEPRFQKFRKLVQDILNSESIPLIEYNWNTKLDYFCPKHGYSAFVLFGLKDRQGQFVNPFTLWLIYPGEQNMSAAESSIFERDRKFKYTLSALASAMSAAERTEIINQNYVSNFLDLCQAIS